MKFSPARAEYRVGSVPSVLSAHLTLPDESIQFETLFSEHVSSEFPRAVLAWRLAGRPGERIEQAIL